MLDWSPWCWKGTEMGREEEEMILPRFFVFSMSRPTIRPTLSIFDLLCTITGCGAGPRKLRLAGRRRKPTTRQTRCWPSPLEMISAPGSQWYQPWKNGLVLPFKVPLSNPRSKSFYKGPLHFVEGTRPTAPRKSLKSAHRRQHGNASLSSASIDTFGKF